MCHDAAINAFGRKSRKIDAMSIIYITVVVGAISAVFLGLAAKRWRTLQLWRDLSVNLLALGVYEVVWILRLAPIVSDPARSALFAAGHPFGMLSLEVLPPVALLAAVWWALRRISSIRLLGVALFATIGCLMVLTVIQPFYLRGIAEAAGFVHPLSSDHDSGGLAFCISRDL